MKGFGLYLLILICLLAGVSYVVSQTQQTDSLSYDQVYNYFIDGDVDQYNVDGTTLTMHLKNENRTFTYELGDYVNVFYNDLYATIQQQMQDGTLTKVDYRTTTVPWWAQFLPYLILIVLLGAFWYFMMNKQSGGGAGPMQFGKARAKLAQDDKRKVTFNDVAGADEEKAELQEPAEVRADRRTHPQGCAAGRPSGYRQNADRARSCGRGRCAVPVHLRLGLR